MICYLTKVKLLFTYVLPYFLMQFYNLFDMNKNNSLKTFMLLKNAVKEIELMYNLSPRLNKKQIKIMQNLAFEIFQASQLLKK